MAETKEPTPPPPPPPPPPKAEKAEKVKARVLVDTEIDGKPAKANDVVSITEKQAASLAGQIDTNPDAVKYAEGLKRKPVGDDALS